MLARELQMRGQQLGHRVRADRVPHLSEGLGELLAALRHPPKRLLWQADRHRLDEAPEVVDNSRIADRQRLATAALAAHTPLGKRPFVEIVLAAIDGRARDPGDPLNDGEAAITGGLHLVCGKQPTATLVELGAHRLPPSSDAILVDHGKRDTSVRAAPESPRVNPPQPTDHDSLISAGVLSVAFPFPDVPVN